MEVIREDITIPVGQHVHLEAELILPLDAQGIVIFSHGSGSSRHSPRNKKVANDLQRSGFATLLFDLLTQEEDRVYENRFNIELLTERLVSVTRWTGRQNEVQHLPIGYFGASTGAASALKAAARVGSFVKAVVSRGGRPDLAIPELSGVETASLLVVGGDDHQVIGLNEQAYAQLPQPKQLEIVPGAGHLFEEPGKLEEVARLAADWYRQYLQA
ncbi:dienelactone hydrolase family protein [Cesiribacter sp. SM1]|uniref:dienelactone hydrolase family protein n=1 Tax=Cesiribacter sp. SM1 TaxID=2861196 RepID=UPI001CD2482C|nr:alpha/beta fold hydrolase [Cesiribacter sp. SM1]